MSPRHAVTAAGTAALLALGGVASPAAAAELSSTSYRVHGSSLGGSVAPVLDSTATTPLVGGAGGTLGEEGVVGRSVGTSGTVLGTGFWAIAMSERIGVCGDGALGVGEACDDGGTSSGDGCWATCELETDYVFEGTAVGGYPVSLTVNGVLISLVTDAGWTADDLAAKLVDQINGDPTLQSLGISAIAIGGRVVTNGVISDVDVQDPGLLPAVPALPLAGLAALVALLAAAGIARLRSPGVA